MGRYTRLLLLIGLWVWASRACALGGDGLAGSSTLSPDSLMALEVRLKAKGKVKASLSEYLAMGDTYFKAGSFKDAEDAYDNALTVDKGSLEAQYGLAYTYFREAAQRGLKAVVYHRRAFGAARQLAETAPQFAPGNLIYGLCYEWLRGDYERAIFYYERYLKMRPDAPDGLEALGRACIETKKYKRVEESVLPYSELHPQEQGLLPIVGQYLLVHGRSLDAADAFRRYVDGLPPPERAFYEDIQSVAAKDELTEYQGLPESDRPAFLKRFWAKRDADILTDVNEGLIEHYRRVWYARTYFSLGKKPWDRRGEVYIRYGEPDFRGRSNHPSLNQSPAVQRVKERIAHILYGADAADEVYVGPGFPIRSVNENAAMDATKAPDITNIQNTGGNTDPNLVQNEAVSPTDLNDVMGTADATQPASSTAYAPVTLRSDQSMVPWESWVYTNINGGIEITFTDETGNSNYDFAPMPVYDHRDMSDTSILSKMARVQEFVPYGVYLRAAAAKPDEYKVAREGIDLGFYYTTADFRGEGGNTRVEVAYGLPTKEMTSFLGGDTMGVVVERAVALATKDLTKVYRKLDETPLQARGSFKKTRGEFIPDLVSLEVPPGDYQLAIQIKDKMSGRTGLYKQELKVKAYGTERLQISDIDLAFAILDSSTTPQFRKGGVYVLPMPSRTYGDGQSAAAYYEVYNLQKDTLGHTRYKVEYTIRGDVEEGFGLLGKTASSFHKLFGGSKPLVSVTYERAGTEASDVGYFTLDLKRGKPGVNKLLVKVTDLISNEDVEQEAVFKYVGNEEKK